MQGALAASSAIFTSPRSVATVIEAGRPLGLPWAGSEALRATGWEDLV
ncbi:hypothetical protein GCM10027596_29470 [Nocardioides korecus]